MYLPIIDAIRGISALLVALDHGLLPSELPIPHGDMLLVACKVFISAPAAVLVFFVVSGFCIHSPNVGRPLDARTFLLRRFIRLLIPLLAATAVAYAVNYRWFELPFGVPVIWSLACEAVYYVLYLFIHPRLTSSRQWLMAVLLSFAVAFVTGYLGRHTMEYPRRDLFSVVLLGLPIWLSGCFVAHRLHTEAKSTHQSATKKATLFMLLILGGGLAAIAKDKLHWSYALTLTAYGMCIAPWLLGVIRLRIEAAVLKLMGDSSYSIYLLHQPLIFPIRDVISNQLPSLPTLGVDLLGMVILFIITTVFYFTVERPSHGLARRLAPSASTPT